VDADLDIDPLTCKNLVGIVSPFDLL
jgi:hypothetical protein